MGVIPKYMTLPIIFSVISCFLCTIDSFTLETTKNKDILVDPFNDELDKLYEEEVTAFYE